MEWITASLKIITAIVCPLWIYICFIRPVKKKRIIYPTTGHYTTPEWNFLLKRWWAEHRLRKIEKKRAQKSQFLFQKSPDELQYIPKIPKEVEGLRILKDEDSSDSTLFYATDQKGNFLFINLTRRRHRTIELIIQLRLADGGTYQLPSKLVTNESQALNLGLHESFLKIKNHPDCLIGNNASRGWSAAGLKVTSLESWRRWRITFNGLLRNGIRRNYHEPEGRIEHIRFNFIFVANDRPLLWPKDWSPGLQAEALAREPWRDAKWINMIKTDKTGGFDQWGSLVGQIIFEDSSSNNLYLRGLRQRRWGMHKAAHLHRTVNIVGLTHDGAMFCLGATSSIEGMTHAQFGHVRQANELLYPVDWSDFDLAFYAEQRENIPTRYEINFKAGGKKYKTMIYRIMESGASLYGGRPWDWEARVFNIETQLNYDKGFGIAYLWYNYNGPSVLGPIPRIYHLLPTSVKPAADLYTVSFNDRLCQSEAAVGGKGSSIALLSSIPKKQFVVPPGFCLTVSALNLQIEQNKTLSEAVTHVENISAGKLDGNLKLACEKAVALFEKTPILEAIQTAIRQSICDLNTLVEKIPTKLAKSERFAVRSSAVGEDSEDTSAAGQNETFLGLRGTDSIINAVAKCWGSLYAYQSVEYRRQHGQPIIAAMGVCVQQMVDAEAAGVMFTRHPTSGDPRQILITANYGLGESVVSAMIEPDTVIIERSWNNILVIKEMKLGKKTHKISMKSQDGTITEELKSGEHNKLCISEEAALRLSTLGVHLETLFGTARDIEWAIIHNEIFLLQARPVTALDTWTEFEIMHELDSPVPSEIDILVFSNVGEVYPGATSPLTLSTIIRSLDNSIEGSMNRLANPYYENCICSTRFRCYINYINTMLRHVESKISLGNKVVDIAVCGHIVTTPELHAAAIRRNGAIGIKFRLKLFMDMIRDTWNNESIVEQATKLQKNFKPDPTRFIRAEHLYRDINESLQILLQASIYHSHTSRVSVFCQVFAMSVLTEGNENFTGEHYSDVSILLSSCSDVVSAQVPTALRDLARTIKNSGKMEEFTKLDPKKAIDWLKDNCTSAAFMFDNFLKQHGSRCIRELDLITETWEMRPENLLATLQATIDSSEKFPIAEELSPTETVDRLKTPKKTATRWILKKLVPLCRSAVVRRELTKAVLVYVVNCLRLAYRRLGKLLVEEGRIPDMNLVFFLTHQEIGLLLPEPNPTLVQKAIRRRRIYPTCDKLQFPEVNIGALVPLVMETKTKIREGGGRVSGTPVCGGSVLGRACIITNLVDAVQLKPGDILITHCTDIGWSPYFPMLGGVVTELGGLISHGAVVAREYGLPCIVGAEGATQIFSTGCTVLLDGVTGVVQVIEETKKL